MKFRATNLRTALPSPPQGCPGLNTAALRCPTVARAHKYHCVLKKDPPGKHMRTIEVYEALSRERESQIKTRIDRTTLTKLRSDSLYGPYAIPLPHRRSSRSNLSTLREEDQDLVHWLTQCPALVTRRWELLGSDSGCLDCMTRHPLRVLTWGPLDTYQCVFF